MCSIAHNEIMISPNGDYRVCSLINDHRFDQGACKDADGVTMNVLTHSFEEASNSQCHQALRASHLADEKSPMCTCCFDRDQLPEGISMRVYKTFEVTKFLDSTEWRSTPSPIVNTRSPIALDLRFGVLCNLKCVVCGPWYSDKWNDDFAAYHHKDTILYGGKLIPITPDAPRVGEINGVAWWESDIWWKRFDGIKPVLRHLYFTGGEPMIVPAHNRVLSELVDQGYAKDIAIEIDTNLTALNPRIINQWRHFKHVDVRVSIDAIGEEYNVARFPSKFSRLENNLIQLLTDLPDSIRVVVSACITPLTVFQMKEMDDWAVKVGLRGDRPVHRRFIEEPYAMSIKFSNKRVKDRILEWLEKNPSSWSASVIEYVRNNYESYHPQADSLARYMDFLDTRRGTNWREVFALAVSELQIPKR